MSTWWGDSKNMEEIEFSRWLFESRLRQGKNVLPDGLNWLCYFAVSSKSHRENSICFIFLESPHQVDMKNVVKCWNNFLFYFTKHRVLYHYLGFSIYFYPYFGHPPSPHPEKTSFMDGPYVVVACQRQSAKIVCKHRIAWPWSLENSVTSWSFWSVCKSNVVITHMPTMPR